MGNRYWVGGSADWDATAGTKWALTSGGAGGQAVPTSGDIVYFDAASGAVTVTVTATAVMDDLICTGFTGTLDGGAQDFDIYGGITLDPGMAFNHTGPLNFRSVAASEVIDFQGITIMGNIVIGYDNSSAAVAWSFASGFTNGDGTGSRSFIFKNGILSLSSYTYYLEDIKWGTGDACTLNLDSAIIQHSCAGWGGAISVNGSTTLNKGTSVILLAGPVALFIAAGKSFATVHLTFTTDPFMSLQGGGSIDHLYNDAPTGWFTWECFGVWTFGAVEFLSDGGSSQCRGAVDPTTVATFITWTMNGVAYDPFRLPSGITISSPAVDDYAPATRSTVITFTCDAAADFVGVVFNNRTLMLDNIGGTSWSKSIYSGYFTGGTLAVDFFAFTSVGAIGMVTAPSTLHVVTAGAVSETSILLSEILGSLTGDGLTATVTLVGEDEFSTNIRSLVKIVVPGYDPVTVDAVRESIRLNSSGWTGFVSATEYSVPGDPLTATSTVVLYRVVHS